MAFNKKRKPTGNPFEAEGVVEKLTVKPYNGKTYYGIVLAGDETLYRNGLEQPDVEVGDYVLLSGVEDNWGKQVSDIEIADKKASAPKASKAASKSGGYNKSKGTGETKASNEKTSKDDYWDKKAQDDKARQRIISYQAAHNTSVAMVVAAMEAGFLPDVASKTKKASAKWDVYQEYIFKVADELFVRFNTALNEDFLVGKGKEDLTPEEDEEEPPFEEEEEKDNDD